MVEQVNLEIKRGDTWSRTIYFEDKDGVRINITGWTIFLTAKEKITDSDSDAKIKKTIPVHTNPTNGESEISLTPDDTNLGINSYIFDIQIKTDKDEIFTVLEGSIAISQDITQRTE